LYLQSYSTEAVLESLTRLRGAFKFQHGASPQPKPSLLFHRRSLVLEANTSWGCESGPAKLRPLEAVTSACL